MKKKFVFATNNPHKLEEVKAILAGKAEIVSLKDIGCYEELPETADTLEGNALMKARFVNRHYQVDCFADDTGLEVEALGGAPGVHSARYADEEGHDAEANIRKLLRELAGKDNRKARFRTVFALILNGTELLFEGSVAGEILTTRRGTAGFGYDSVFLPKGYTQTFAEMGENLKNQISHRAIAVNKLCHLLQSI